MERRSKERGSRSIPTSWQRAVYIPLIALLWVAFFLTAGWLLTHVVKTVLTLLLSGIVAFALTPLVSLLARRMPRVLAIAVAYVLGFAVVFGVIALVVVTAAGQVTHLVANLPKYAHQAQRLEPQVIRLLGPLGVTQANFQHAQQQSVAHVQQVGTAVASQSLGIVGGVLGVIIDIVLVLILSVYLTANRPKIAQRLRRETPGGHRWRTDLFIGIINQVVGGYIRGMLTLATLIGVLVGVGMWMLHVPYPVLLGLLAFFIEFIPVVGVLISGAVCVVLALFVSWITTLLVLGYFVFVHIIEGDVVGPRIMGKAVGIHPATGLIALVAGTELFGIWGALLAAPIAGLLQAIGTAAWLELRGGDPGAVLHEAMDANEQKEPVAAVPVPKPAQS